MTCTDTCRKPNGRMAHCGSCHLTFSGLRGFDDHRVGGSCAAPAIRGMTAKNGVWGNYGTRPAYYQPTPADAAV